jgi:hypothetical protein
MDLTLQTGHHHSVAQHQHFLSVQVACLVTSYMCAFKRGAMPWTQHMFSSLSCSAPDLTSPGHLTWLQPKLHCHQWQRMPCKDLAPHTTCRHYWVSTGPHLWPRLHACFHHIMHLCTCACNGLMGRHAMDATHVSIIHWVSTRRPHLWPRLQLVQLCH